MHRSTDQWNKIWSLERDPQNTQALIKLAFQISDEIYSVNGVGAISLLLAKNKKQNSKAGIRKTFYKKLSLR